MTTTKLCCQVSIDKRMTSVNNWITSEIQQMMFGFGDCRRPSEETANLVADIVHQQMVSMMNQASEVAAMRGDKPVAVEDILFLMRKDKVKLKRLLHYYEVRDLKNTFKSAGANEDPLKHEAALGKPVIGKNRQMCYDFLATIDQTGELLALFDDKETDIVKHERLVRAELQSRGMDTQQYMEFCQARQANFSRKYSKSQRFRDWLFAQEKSEIALSPQVIELFSYLAYECVGQIVDLALLVKQDKRAQPGDPSSRGHPPLSINYAEIQAGSLLNKSESCIDDAQSPTYDNAPHLSAHLTGAQIPGASASANATAQAVSAALGRAGMKRKRKKSEPAASVEASWDSQILPNDVREALRRYYTDISPFASMLKSSPHCSPWRKTLVS